VPGKTNTEVIRELERAVATLAERLDNVRREIDRLDPAHAKTAESLTKAVTQLTVLEEKFADLKKALEESDRKRWMLTVAVAGTFLALVGNIALSFFRK
jgi:predicted  nucleic acid-binding Zn-ribbon protein